MSPSNKRRLTWQGGTFPAQTAGGGAGRCGAFHAAGADMGSAASGNSGTHSHTVQAETTANNANTLAGSHTDQLYHSPFTTAKHTLVTIPKLSNLP